LRVAIGSVQLKLHPLRANHETEDDRAKSQRGLELVDKEQHGLVAVPGHFGKLNQRTEARLRGDRIGRLGQFLALEPDQEASCGR
jgi:hypothetical protein